MRLSRNPLLRIMHRRTRNGQSIIIIAAAFLALIAFVGIAVDVALLFSRYSTLRRAVDAAAIAAASHMRQDSNYTSLVAIASQYMKLHGLDASSIKVETCETEQFDLQQQSGSTQPLATILAYANNKPPYNDTNNKPPSELCTASPEKVLRVSAQIQSPTAFLSLFGWRTVTLVASSTSQQAALDVALILDSSFSEALDTYDAESDQTKYPCASGKGDTTKRVCFKPDNSSLPGTIFNTAGDTTEWTNYTQYTNSIPLLNFTDFTNLGLTPYATDSNANGMIDSNEVNYTSGSKAIRPECWVAPRPGSSSGRTANYAWAGCCNDPTVQSRPNSATALGVANELNDDPGWYLCDRSSSNQQSIINTNGYACNDTSIPPNSGATVLSSQDDSIASSRTITIPANPPSQPNAITYNPDTLIYSGGDGNYSDLICQPFKQVRDAARSFLKKLDFVRGDRAVLVNFDASAHLQKVSGSTSPFLTSSTDAIRTLNYFVGVEVNSTGLYTGCSSMSNGTNQNPALNVTYWTISQCPDTNTGDGILTAMNGLTDPQYMRRESVWVMVMLSDGYPNRTPPQAEIGGPTADQGLGPLTNNWLNIQTVDKCDPKNKTCVCHPPDSSTGDLGFQGAYTDSSGVTRNDYAGNVGYVVCTGGQGGPSLGLNAYTPQQSYGFCPWWTFCKNGDPSCTENNPKSVWSPSTTNEPYAPYCTNNDPYARHFCSDVDGNVNPDPATGALCDPHYDATDFARDMTDFAGLLDYTPTQKGNFIAMFTIFFGHTSVTGSNTLGENVLGVQFMRYMSDVGDNGVIDNHLQQWYRQQHYADVTKQFDNPNTPSTYPGSYNGQDPYFAANLNSYTTTEDPCAQYDPAEIGAWGKAIDKTQLVGSQGQAMGDASAPLPGSAAYESALKQQCGNYYYANDLGTITGAFTEIAGKLFTRLSR